MRRDKNLYPSWVCAECAQKAGGRFPEGYQATWCEEKCGVCGEVKSVTDPRNFGYPDFTEEKKT